MSLNTTPSIYSQPVPSSSDIIFTNHLTLKLLDAVVHLARHKRQRHNTRNVHLRAEDLHAQAQLGADGLDVLETFLVVGTGAADPDLDLVLDEEGRDFAEGADDTLECACDLDCRVSFAVCVSCLELF